MTKVKEVSLSLTFEQDTIICFNRTEFNLKGYRYYIDIEDRLCVLEQDEMPRLKAELGDNLFVLLCIANSLGIDMTESFDETMQKFNTRDYNRFERK